MKPDETEETQASEVHDTTAEATPSCAIAGSELETLAADEVVDEEDDDRPSVEPQIDLTPLGTDPKKWADAFIAHTDAPSALDGEIFRWFKEALRAGRGAVMAAEDAKHCPACGAPKWAADPRKVVKA